MLPQRLTKRPRLVSRNPFFQPRNTRLAIMMPVPPYFEIYFDPLAMKQDLPILTLLLINVCSDSSHHDHVASRLDLL